MVNKKIQIKKAIESSTAFQFYKKGAISYFHKIVYDPAQ